MIRLYENTFIAEDGFSQQTISEYNYMVNELNKVILLDEVDKEFTVGKSELIFEIAIEFLFGGRVDKDISKAIEIFEKAINLGNADAMSYLGVVYMNEIPTENNILKALKLFKRASSLGQSDGMVNLAQYYYVNGNDEEKSNVIELFTKASNLNNAEGMFWLYKSYMDGILVEKNTNIAEQWLGKAILNNSQSAIMAAEKCGLSSLYSELTDEITMGKYS